MITYDEIQAAQERLRKRGVLADAPSVRRLEELAPPTYHLIEFPSALQIWVGELLTQVETGDAELLRLKDTLASAQTYETSEMMKLKLELAELQGFQNALKSMVLKLQGMQVDITKGELHDGEQG